MPFRFLVTSKLLENKICLHGRELFKLAICIVFGTSVSLKLMVLQDTWFENAAVTKELDKFA